MQALSGLDASFLFLETNKVPMHIGSVAIIEGTLQFEEFKSFIEERIHLVERLTQKLAFSPLNIDRPYWVKDADFDINFHLYRTALPNPGGWKELRYLASHMFSQHLNQDRPLWHFTFVEGIDDIAQVPKGSVALISRVHHAAFDGKSGEAMMSMLYDLSPKPRKVKAPTPSDQQYEEELPSTLNLLTKSALNLMSRSTKLPGLLWDTGKATLKTGYLSKVYGIDMPTLPFSAPRTRFNQSVSAERTWNSAILDLKRVKHIRKAVPDTTLNDVVLSIIAGAVRKYLQEKDELPTEPLVAMVPISTRGSEDKQSMGNQISAMFVQLATDVEAPLERLARIHLNTIIGKLYQDAIDAKSLVEYAELIPFGLAGVAARMYSRANISEKHKPIFNMVITNVPGPQVPLYMAGHKLHVNMGTAPIIDGMALMIPVLSYNGTLSISPTSATNIMPDMDKFTRYIRESANELEAAALNKLHEKGQHASIAEDLSAHLSEREHE